MKHTYKVVWQDSTKVNGVACGAIIFRSDGRRAPISFPRPTNDEINQMTPAAIAQFVRERSPWKKFYA